MKLPAPSLSDEFWMDDLDAFSGSIPAAAFDRLPINRPPAEMDAAIEAMLLANLPAHILPRFDFPDFV